MRVKLRRRVVRRMHWKQLVRSWRKEIKEGELCGGDRVGACQELEMKSVRDKTLGYRGERKGILVRLNVEARVNKVWLCFKALHVGLIERAQGRETYVSERRKVSERL